MQDLIRIYNCYYCDEELNSESHVVFCNEACLAEYVADAKSLEEFLTKQKEQEDE